MKTHVQTVNSSQFFNFHHSLHQPALLVFPLPIRWLFDIILILFIKFNIHADTQGEALIIFFCFWEKVAENRIRGSFNSSLHTSFFIFPRFLANYLFSFLFSCSVRICRRFVRSFSHGKKVAESWMRVVHQLWRILQILSKNDSIVSSISFQLLLAAFQNWVKLQSNQLVS